MDWVIQHAPIAVWITSGLGVVLFVHRYFGLRAAASAAVAVFVFILNARARQTGWKAREEKGRKDAEKAVKESENARRDADLRNADPERLRESDGYRRD
jgi:ABC-type protease/lipase transport system fused ATPase/permease subunit